MYTAIVLEESSRQLILDKFSSDLPSEFIFSDGVHQLSHHMTINLGRFDEHLNSRDVLEKPAVIRCSELVYNVDLGVCALSVDVAYVLEDETPIHSMNLCPHITVALIPPAKPKTSNILLGKRPWQNQSIFEEIWLYGTVTVLN